MKKYLIIGLIVSLLFPYLTFAYDLTDKDRGIVSSATTKIEKIISTRGESVRARIIVLLEKAIASSSNVRLQTVIGKTIENLRPRDVTFSDLVSSIISTWDTVATGSSVTQNPLVPERNIITSARNPVSSSNTTTATEAVYTSPASAPEAGCANETHLEGNRCVDSVQSCLVSNWAGRKIWNGNSWTNCIVTICAAWYVISDEAWLKAWVGDNYLSCTSPSCYAGFTGSGGSCILPVTNACSTDNVSAWGYTYSTKSMPDGKCWTTANMKHASGVGNKWNSNDEVLYDWNAATSSNLCPALWAGWTLPTMNQWQDLRNTGASGWTGNKAFGLISVLPGLRDGSWKFFWQWEAGQWWSSTECSSSDCNTGTNAWMMKLWKYASNMSLFSQGVKSEAYSVVCVKN